MSSVLTQKEVSVPFVDLKQRAQEEEEELMKAVSGVITAGRFVLTSEVDEFESAVSDYIGVKHCVGLNSGTDALMVGMMALGIGRGDEVITPPNSFVASTASIAHIGATPVYVDVDETQNLDPRKIEAAITPRTKAIMPVHWTGRIADMDPIQEIADRHGLKIVEDAAQAMGAFYRGRRAGGFGHFSAFSCHPLKNFNALGDGGFLITNDDELALHCRRYRNHGLQDRETCLFFGVNSRLDSLHAKVLTFRLTRLKSVIDRRAANVKLYQSLIRAPEVEVPVFGAHESSSHSMFIVRAERRAELKDFLARAGVESLIYYGVALHLQPATAKLGYVRGDFPVAEHQADRVLALPHHQHLTEAQITHVANTVNQFYGVNT